MIRALGHALRLGLILGLLGGASWMLWPWVVTAWSRFDRHGLGADDPRLAAGNAEVVRVYALEEHRALDFPIITQGDRIRIVTNASVPPQQADRPALSWPYQVEYQLVDDAGRIIKEEVYHQRTSVSWYQTPDGTPQTAAFYLNSLAVPADSRIILLNLREAPGATHLRLRLAGHAPEIEGVVARVYVQGFLLDSPDVYQWQRLGRPLREQLAQASVFGAELMTVNEQINLTRQRWSPIAPGGALDHDYHAKKLYVVSDVESQTPRLPILPAGNYIDRDLRAVMPIPEPGGMVDIELTDVAALVTNAGLGSGAQGTGASSVRLFWHGQKPSQHAEYELDAGGAETRWAGRFDPGLLEIVAERPLVARAYLRQEHDRRLPLFGEPLYQRVYRLDPGQTLEFIVAHAAGQPTFWRFDALLAAPDKAAATTVQYELLDGQGAVLRRGELAVPQTLSMYNSLVSQQAFFDRVSEPASASFVLPKTVARVRLRTTAPVFIAGYSRPADLPRRVRVPEDYLSNLTKDRGQPFWFPVLPVTAPDMLREGRTALMIVQDRPTQPDADVLAGRYDWRDFDPAGTRRGRYLLIPREPGIPLRPEARGSVFRPLAVGTPVRLDFQGTPGHLMVEPTLLALRDNDEPCPVRVLMDGEAVYSDTLLVRRSEIRLPPRPAGAHTLTIEACPSPGRWLVNYAGEAPDSLVRRMGYRLDGAALDFIYPKSVAGEQILTGVVHTPANQQGRLRLRVTVETPPRSLLGPTTRLTAREWTFDVLPDHSEALPVLDTATEVVGLGQRFFLPLGDDLPIGDYRIRVRAEEGRGYLTLSQVIPGEPAALELFSEEKKQ